MNRGGTESISLLQSLPLHVEPFGRSALTSLGEGQT